MVRHEVSYLICTLSAYKMVLQAYFSKRNPLLENLLCLTKNENRDEICLYRCTIINEKWEIVSKRLHDSILITTFANQ